MLGLVDELVVGKWVGRKVGLNLGTNIGLTLGLAVGLEVVYTGFSNRKYKPDGFGPGLTVLLELCIVTESTNKLLNLLSNSKFVGSVKFAAAL